MSQGLARLSAPARMKFTKALGVALRRERRRQGMTRAELNNVLGEEVSVQTLATYELGTRKLSVERFVDLCLASEIEPGRLLTDVLHTSVPELARRELQLDLKALAKSGTPLSRWASFRLDCTHGGATVIRVDSVTLQRLKQFRAWHPDLLGVIDGETAA